MEGDSAEYILNITNEGDGILEWSACRQIRDVPEPWTLLHSENVSAIVNDTRLRGVVFADDHYYVCGDRTRDEDPYIYVLDREFTYVDSFRQSIADDHGFDDLAWDGELIWGSDREWLVGFNTEGTVINEFRNPLEHPQHIVWDNQRQLLWITGNREDIYGCDRDGIVVESLNSFRLNIKGLGYYQDDDDGYNLYLTYSSGDNEHVCKLSIVTNDTLFVGELISDELRWLRSSYISELLFEDSWVMLTIGQYLDADHDFIKLWQVDGDSRWMYLEPVSGILNPDDDQDLILTINASDLTPREYPGELYFTHNGVGGETSIPVDLTVTELGIDNRVPHPFLFTPIETRNFYLYTT